MALGEINLSEATVMLITTRSDRIEDLQWLKDSRQAEAR